jgi:putative esterase
VLAGAAVVSDVLPGGPRARRVLGLTGPDGEIPHVPVAPVATERIRSTARGRDVDLVVIRPSGKRLPVCLALHGRGAGAGSFLDMGLPQFLTAATRAGVPPFAVVAVDCGDHYFMGDRGDDPLRMLTGEVPRWLAERGLPAPTAALGISMGAHGALRLAREIDLAVAVAGPALFRDWGEAEVRHAFRDERQWAAVEPLRHTGELTGTALGVWCGTEDPFVDAAREFADRTHPAVAAFDGGAHETGYFLRVLPDMLRFVGVSVA